FSSRRRHTRWPRDWSSDVCSSDLYYRGCVAYNQGKIATAEACFRRAVERKPDYALALYQLGLCREHQDDPAGASAAFQAAIASRPNLAEAHRDWARLLIRQGRREEAGKQ